MLALIFNTLSNRAIDIFSALYITQLKEISRVRYGTHILSQKSIIFVGSWFMKRCLFQRIFTKGKSMVLHNVYYVDKWKQEIPV